MSPAVRAALLAASVALVSSCSSGGDTPAPRDTAAAPTFSPADPLRFDAPLSVELATATADATIHYTTDGTTPTASSPSFTTPIPIADTMTVKAIAVRPDMNDSAVASITYVHRAVTLVLDDGTWEFAPGGATVAMINLNRFSPAADDFPFQLHTVSLFSNLAVGSPIRIAVYTDQDGDPSNGITFVASHDAASSSEWGWSVLDLPVPVTLHGPGDVLIGQIATGASFFFDSTAGQARSWYGFWYLGPGDPASPPPLGPELNDANFMIRGSN